MLVKELMDAGQRLLEVGEMCLEALQRCLWAVGGGWAAEGDWCGAYGGGPRNMGTKLRRTAEGGGLTLNPKP